MPVQASQALFYLVGVLGDVEDRSANFLRVDGRTRVGVHNDEVWLAVDLPNRHAAVQHSGINPQRLLEVVVLRRSANAVKQEQPVTERVIAGFEKNRLFAVARQGSNERVGVAVPRPGNSRLVPERFDE